MNAINYNHRLHTVTVTDVKDISARLRQVRFSGSSMRELKWIPGQKIKLKAGSKMKSYTPAHYNSNEGWMDIIFHLHGNGEASHWAENVSVGGMTTFIGPFHSMPFIEGKPDWFLFLGDETTLGLALALSNALPKEAAQFGFIELDTLDINAIKSINLPYTAVGRLTTHGEALKKCLLSFDYPSGTGQVWISGEAGVATEMSAFFRQAGFCKEQLKIKPYWSLKGHAHRKGLQRELCI